MLKFIWMRTSKGMIKVTIFVLVLFVLSVQNENTDVSNINLVQSKLSSIWDEWYNWVYVKGNIDRNTFFGLRRGVLGQQIWDWPVFGKATIGLAKASDKFNLGIKETLYQILNILKLSELNQTTSQNGFSDLEQLERNESVVTKVLDALRMVERDQINYRIESILLRKELDDTKSIVLKLGKSLAAHSSMYQEHNRTINGLVDGFTDFSSEMKSFGAILTRMNETKLNETSPNEQKVLKSSVEPERLDQVVLITSMIGILVVNNIIVITVIYIIVKRSKQNHSTNGSESTISATELGIPLESTKVSNENPFYEIPYSTPYSTGHESQNGFI